MPAAHRIAHALGRRGVRGARVYWAAAVRLAALPVGRAVRMPTGITSFVDPDDWISRNAYFGLYERAELVVFRRLLKPGDVVVDVGANVGHWALHMSRWVQPTGRVIAVEPSPRCLKALERGVDVNAAANVSIVPAAAGALEGEAQLSGHLNPRHSGLGTLTGPPGEHTPAVRVPVRPLSSLLNELDVDRCALVKVDVEGFEPEVLAGLEPHLKARAVDSLMLEVSPALGTHARVAEAVASLGPAFRSFRVAESGALSRRPVLIPIDRRGISTAREQFNLLVANGERCTTLRGLIRRRRKWVEPT